MKKCKILISFVDGEHNSFSVGKIYEIEDKLAKALVEVGVAEIIEEPKKQVKKSVKKRTPKKAGGTNE